jgi:hypothetical protein
MTFRFHPEAEAELNDPIDYFLILFLTAQTSPGLLLPRSVT